MHEWQEWCNAISSNELDMYYKNYLNRHKIYYILKHSTQKKKHRKKQDLKETLEMDLFLLIGQFYLSGVKEVPNRLRSIIEIDEDFM